MERMSDKELKEKYDSIQADFNSPLPYELEVEHLAERQRADWLKIGYERLEKENKELSESRDRIIIANKNTIWELRDRVKWLETVNQAHVDEYHEEHGIKPRSIPNTV